MTSGDWLLGADLIGVAVFAASGASAGIAKRLDLFGVAFAGFIAALGGGILRDVMIGSVP
ncbi:MAG TPA: TRIC cation channel family protein, partial [Actinoplanes sp.]|nr:TRIC cation channel family protein [Actinoplanes sp.]